jgi:hypothetical protein
MAYIRLIFSVFLGVLFSAPVLASLIGMETPTILGACIPFEENEIELSPLGKQALAMLLGVETHGRSVSWDIRIHTELD